MQSRVSAKQPGGSYIKPCYLLDESRCRLAEIGDSAETLPISYTRIIFITRDDPASSSFHCPRPAAWRVRCHWRPILDSDFQATYSLPMESVKLSIKRASWAMDARSFPTPIALPPAPAPLPLRRPQRRIRLRWRRRKSRHSVPP